MKIVRNNIIPLPGYKAVNILGVLFVRKKTRLSDTDLTHESIHTEQIKETLYVGFYLLYVLEWFMKLVIYADWHTAYRAVSFEREAYLYQDNADYPKTRKHYAWVKLIKD